MEKILNSTWHIAKIQRHAVQKYFSLRNMFITFLCINLFFLYHANAYMPNNNEEFNSNQHLNLSQGSFIAWYQQCLKKNYKSCGLVGRAYYEGYGVLPNMMQAQKYFKAACENGIVESCLYLSNFKQSGDIKYNDFLYEQACALGHNESCNKAKNMLIESINEDSSVEKRRFVYESLQKICKTQGESGCNVAQEFANKFMNLDETISIAIFKNKLEQCKNAQNEYSDDLYSCGEVGIMYANGIGIQQNKEEAKRYFHISCFKHKEFCRYEILDSILN